MTLTPQSTPSVEHRTDTALDVTAWEQDIPLSLKYYLGGFLTFLPGFVFGSAVLLPWYIAAAYFVVQKRLYHLIVLFVVWNFLGRGAYHYGLLGPSESALLIRALGTAILLGMLIVYAQAPRRHSGSIRPFFVLVGGWFAVTLVSAAANSVVVMDLLQYYLIYFRWFLFALVVLTAPLQALEYRRLFALVVAIVGFNSILGVLQQYVLPVQVTPAGYVPDYYDLPSGLLGVTFSQHLTALCVVVATLFVVRYSKDGGNRNLLGVIVFVAQPFTSSSKAIMFIMFALMFGALAYAHRKDLFRKGTLLFRMGALALVGWIGFSVYVGMNVDIHGSPEDQLAAVTDKIGTIEDFKKLMGYVNVIDDVAPWGGLGWWFGVGPGQFLNVVSGERLTNFSDAIEVGTEEVDLSSFEKQDTEMVATIGELGLAGCVVQCLAMGSLFLSILKRLKEAGSYRTLSVRLALAVLASATMILTWYTQAWSVAFYYIPLFLMVAYDIQSVSGNQAANACEVSTLVSAQEPCP